MAESVDDRVKRSKRPARFPGAFYHAILRSSHGVRVSEICSSTEGQLRRGSGVLA
jgi:hypothetical protein